MTLKKVDSITCDGEGCSHVREQDANHWLVGLAFDGEIRIAINRSKLHIPHDLEKRMKLEEDNEDNSIKDFCGEQCAVKWLSKMLQEIKR